jgi:hypothetical protein
MILALVIVVTVAGATFLVLAICKISADDQAEASRRQ